MQELVYVGEANKEQFIMDAAEQNFARDCRVGLVVLQDWESMSRIYQDEARALLADPKFCGENYLPEYPDHLHLIWKKE